MNDPSRTADHRASTARALANVLDDVAQLMNEGDSIGSLAAETVKLFAESGEPVPSDAAISLAVVCGRIAEPGQ
jgi:hypothetical protein